MPPAQLLIVPMTFVPVGSADVRMRGWPAAGPEMAIGVSSAVMRRAYLLSGTSRHLPSCFLISMTEPPWQAISMSTISLVTPLCCIVVLAEAGEHHLFVGVLVVDAQQAVLGVVGAEGQGDIADEVVVVAELLAWAAALWAYGSNGGAPGITGSPQRISTSAL